MSLEDGLLTKLRSLINGYQVSQAIHVAAVLGVADRMTDGRRTCDEIAAAVDAHPRSLYRLLRALAAFGLFHEHEGQSFSLSPMGEYLRSDVKKSLRPFAVFIGQDYQRQAWGKLLHAVKTGGSAFTAAHSMNTWQYRALHPEQNTIFNDAMHANSRRVNAAIIQAYDFSGYARIADIGGGQGSLLAEILIAHPQMRGVLYDQPHVIAEAGSVFTAAGVRDRCQLDSGDMFESVPGDCHAYVMKYVLHDWGDGDALRILSTCRFSMPEGSKLIVIERFLGPPNQDPVGKFADLGMLVGPGGQERTREELSALLLKGGFQVVEMIATGTPLFVTVAKQVAP